jgi:hypothetical protein
MTSETLIYKRFRSQPQKQAAHRPFPSLQTNLKKSLTLSPTTAESRQQLQTTKL